jgi:NADPH-dependent ferric siderophore reductase
MARPFRSSANVLFDTEVRRVSRLSPGFVRLTLTGAHLNQFAAHGLDQRIKILVPTGRYHSHFDDELVHESEWRRRWRDGADTDRPALRSYTISAVRPGQREVDIDFFVHASPGPASSWALTAKLGARLLVSGPSSRLTEQASGIQWSPGGAVQVLLAGDETAFPAIRGIASTLPPSIRTTIILEVGDPADADWLIRDLPGRSVSVYRRARSAGGFALLPAVEAWTRAAGADAAALGAGFYAWVATESSQVARVRALLQEAGIDPGRVHSQGYWNDRVRVDSPRWDVRLG